MGKASFTGNCPTCGQLYMEKLLGEVERLRKGPQGIGVLLTTAQAARFFNVDIQKMRLWRSEGSGPKYIKLGSSRQSRIRYSPEAIQEFISLKTRNKT